MEKDIVKKIKEYLESQGCLVYKYHGSIYTIKGFTDLFGMISMDSKSGCAGRMFFLEVKLPNKKLRLTQESFIQSVLEKGAIAMVVRSLEEVKEKFSLFL